MLHGIGRINLCTVTIAARNTMTVQDKK
jgi:hypothetical protein